MLSQNEKELDQLMVEYKENIQGLREKKLADKKVQEGFQKEFERLKREIIWPTIVDLGNYLTNYGHDYHVVEDLAYTDGTASYHPARLTFYVYPATAGENLRKPESAPYVSFVADTYARKVSVMVSTMMPGGEGMIGEHGRFDVSEISKDFVEKTVIEVLKNTLILHKSE